MVAQIDEQHTTVIADAMTPAGKPYGFADFALAERAAGMGAVSMHGDPCARCGPPIARNVRGQAHASSNLSRQRRRNGIPALASPAAMIGRAGERRSAPMATVMCDLLSVAAACRNGSPTLSTALIAAAGADVSRGSASYRLWSARGETPTDRTLGRLMSNFPSVTPSTAGA